MFFTNSGAEANEAAFKLTRYYATKKYDVKKNNIISFYNSCHGRTLFTVSVGGQSQYSDFFEPTPLGIQHAEFNQIETVKNIINKDTCTIVLE